MHIVSHRGLCWCQGTKNVLNSCKKAGAKKVVLTSSTAAIYLNRHPKGHLTTEVRT